MRSHVREEIAHCGVNCEDNSCGTVLDSPDELHWLPVREQVKFKVACLVRQSLSGHAPLYLADVCRLVSDSTRRSLRSADVLTCVLPPTLSTVAAPEGRSRVGFSLCEAAERRRREERGAEGSSRRRRRDERRRREGRDTITAERGRVWGGCISLPIRLGGLGERRKLPSGVWGGAPAEIDFGASCH